MAAGVHLKPPEPIRMTKMTTPNLPGYYSEREQAARLGLALSSLRRWRRLKFGPTSVRIGRRVLYPHGADEKWLAAQQAATERKPNGSGGRRRGRVRRVGFGG
jgi:hypothetical protein